MPTEESGQLPPDWDVDGHSEFFQELEMFCPLMPLTLYMTANLANKLHSQGRSVEEFAIEGKRMGDAIEAFVEALGLDGTDSDSSSNTGSDSGTDYETD